MRRPGYWRGLQSEGRGPLRIGLCHGGAEGVYREAREALRLLQGAGALVSIIACNEAGIRLPVLHHWCTLHPSKLLEWEELRRAKGLPGGYVRWSVSKMPTQIDRTVRNWRGGSSGLHMFDVGLNALKLDGVIGCGVPLETLKNEFRGDVWSHAGAFRSGWMEPSTLATLKAKARTMSGWTRELLGEPTVEWLASL